MEQKFKFQYMNSAIRLMFVFAVTDSYVAQKETI
jgi:hypothetical protein